MFSGPTAHEWVGILAAKGDAPRPGQSQTCDYCGNVEVSSDELIPVHGVGCLIQDWVARCENDRDQHGLGDDIFYCDGCDHEHYTNSSWELHYSETEDGMLCLKCNAERAVRADNFWVTDEDEVTEEWVRDRPHLTPNLVPGILEESEWGETLDSMSGGPLYDESRNAQANGAVAIRDQVARALEHHDRVSVVISRAYQFAVYLEVVTPA